MKNKAIILMIVVVGGLHATIFLVGGLQLGNESNEPRTDEYSVTSNDESAKLLIPKNILPEGVDVKDISVTRIPNSELEDESWIVYELAPDGLEFNDEILLQVILDSENNTMPFVYIITSTEIDLINNTRSEVDLETNKTLVSVPLTHFSRLGLQKVSIYSVFASAQDTSCGEQVLTTFRFTLDINRITMRNPRSGSYNVWKILDRQVVITGTWVNEANDGVTPVGKFGGKPGA